MDVVTELLAAVRLTGSAFLRADLRAPFAIETMTGRATCAAFGQDFEHVIPYHLVTRGSCWAGFRGEPMVEATRGTVLLFPRGEAHVLANTADAEPVPIKDYLSANLKGPLAISLGGNGATSQIICGYLACERRRWNPLLESLPRMMLVDIGSGPVATWMSSSLEYATHSDERRLDRQ
ncbi:MAG: cupin domain-containing protein [Steroidobacteraceae bacterium]